ncbi:unnamed protein product [Polarella glacialis]|uniref:Protein xylosyltransferase n=1 Tax=Polarella glacialis TaxID=89957 RepID=A0A813IXP8_POLGL|nr:unnamed protein product [Polarella glacialis]|mmetsp:Transcript_50302/g.90390  ORF Transcript_50302/g.90390 Transcript_50302/m.90390 type:complete len:395 (-) Transcript_50302:126-1310(-)
MKQFIQLPGAFSFCLALGAFTLCQASQCSHGTGLLQSASHLKTISAVNSSWVSPPKVNFLFLATNRISNIKVWKRFFESAPSTLYRAFAHCANSRCKSRIAVHAPFIQFVPRVNNTYCEDLVSPMIQLLEHALAGSPEADANEFDKFVFLSDSSLPAKSFMHVYSTLTSRDTSDLCVWPPQGWATLPSKEGLGLDVALKAHQWSALTRRHAKEAVDKWNSGFMRNVTDMFQINAHLLYVERSVLMESETRTLANNHNIGCLDEFWFMAALVGTLKNVNASAGRLVNLPGVTGSPISTDVKVGWQGNCDTMVIWEEYEHAFGYDRLEAVMESLDLASVPNAVESIRPAQWNSLSFEGLQAIHASDFLFVRKIVDKPDFSGGDFEQAFVSTVLQAL